MTTQLMASEFRNLITSEERCSYVTTQAVKQLSNTSWLITADCFDDDGNNTRTVKYIISDNAGVLLASTQ
jgi:hypothetical protein